MFVERFKANDWDEKEERDDSKFLELEKAIYLETHPNDGTIFDEEEVEEDMVEGNKDGEIMVVDSDSDNEEVVEGEEC